MDDSKYDDFLFDMLTELGQISPFLNVVFGFLFRRTDFFCVQEDPNGNVGFPPGAAEGIVINIMRKYEHIAHARPQQQLPRAQPDELPHLLIQEVEVETTPLTDDDILQKKSEPVPSSVRTEDPSSDIYNGADCGSYKWSQSIQDLDIQVVVPKTILKASDVKVDVQPQRLVVQIKGEDSNWKILLEGDLTFKNMKDESIWSLVPGRHILIHMEKCVQRWWEALLTTEPKLDLESIDSARSIIDLPEDDQMKIEELMWNERRRRQGEPTTQQMELESILKKAWDVEGSPFKGTPFDPTVIVNYPKRDAP